MDEKAEFRVKIPVEAIEQVRARKEGRRLEATNAELQQAFAGVLQKKGEELLKNGELRVRDVYKIVLEEAESRNAREGGFGTSTIKISIPIPPELFEKAGRIREEYTGGLVPAKRKDIVNATMAVLKEVAYELILDGEAEVKDLYLLLLEKIE